MADYLELARAEVRRLKAAAAQALGGPGAEPTQIAGVEFTQTAITGGATPQQEREGGRSSPEPRQLAFDGADAPSESLINWRDL